MNRYSQFGVSMVELMVATVVGLFLTAGIIQLFVSSKQAYRSEEGFARLQENARYALDQLSRDLRMHGNMGCDTLSGLEREEQYDTGGTEESPETYFGSYNVLADDLLDTNGVFADSDFLIGTSVPIGYRVESASDLEKGLINNSNTITLKTGTDALILSGALEEGVYLGSDMVAWTSSLQLAENGGIGQGDLLLISDCHNVDIFEVTNDVSGGTTIEHGDSANLNTELSTLYKVYSDVAINAMVYPFSTKSYFIATDDNDTDAVPSMYVRYLGSSPREIVENVEDMVLTFYGHDDDADGDPDGYERAGSVTNWDEVQSVRMQLLVRSPEKILLESTAFTWDGTAYNDRYQREEFSTTVALRSQVNWRMN